MSTYVWLVIWAVVIVTVAAVYVRERRSGRPEVAEFDRNDHEAVREASVNLVPEVRTGRPRRSLAELQAP